MKLRRHLIPAAALAATLVLLPAPAFAQTDDTTTTTRPPRTAPPRPERPERTGEGSGERAGERAERREQMIEQVKARCLAQVERRQRALESDRRRLSEADVLTDAHRAALLRINESVSNGLAALADEIQAEDNGEELRSECRRIVEDFRVFTLVRPRARLVLASDRELHAVARLTNVASDIQAAIDEAKADGRDTTDAEAQLAAMRAAIASAQQHAGSVFDAVIGLTAADYNANHDVLDPARQSVRSAREAIRTAVAAGRAAMEDLRSTDS